MLNIAVFVSGGGPISGPHRRPEGGEVPRGGDHPVRLLLQKNTPWSGPAKRTGIGTAILRRRDYPSQEALDDALLDVLEAHDIGLIVWPGT